MAFYDKSARMMSAVGLSLAIHVVVVGLLVSTQLFSGDSPKEESSGTAEPVQRDLPEPEKPSEDTPLAEPAPIQSSVPESAERPKPEPVAKPVPAPQPAVKPRPKKEAKAKPEVKEGSETAETEVYVVKKGESLSTIARAHGCSLAELTKLNKATLKKNKSLFVGAKLRVPKK